MDLYEIATFFTAINILILFILTFLVIKLRRAQGVSIGHNDNEDMQRAIRVHGNFTEYAPLAMIGLFAMAACDASAHWMYGIGGAFTLGRLMHAYGYSKVTGKSIGRFYGMLVTWLSLLVMAQYLLYLALT